MKKESTEIEAYIFDLDGVIVDTAKYHYQSWKKLASRLGFDFSQEQNEKLKGLSRIDSLDILLKIGNKSFNDAEKTALAREKNEDYLEQIESLNPDELLPGVKDLLKKAKQQGKKLALASSSKNAQLIIKKLDLLSYFDAIITGNDVINAKPDPEIFLKAAEALKVKPENAIVFEDAVAGVEAARGGGFYAVGIGNKQTLHQADMVIKDLSEFNFD